MVNPRLPLLPLILDRVPQGLRQALAQEGIPTGQRRRGTPEGRYLLYDSMVPMREPPAPGQIPINIDALRSGCEEDPFEALLDEQSDRFQWEIAGLTLSEEIARVDKRAVRRQLLERLRAMVERTGGVWLRVSAFPFPYRSAMSFRIDYDRYVRHDFEATLRAIAGHEHATSHFVNGAAYEGAPGALARLRGLDVGSHGYWHHTYRTAEENLRNVRRGMEALGAAGIEPSGFVAPHGRFNRGLLWALETLGVGHSSEFGLAYDELPFFPAGSRVLQLPIHPVSLGIFLEAARRPSAAQPQEADRAAAAAAERAAHYFLELVLSRYGSGEPAFLYGHPTGRLGRYPHVLRRLFEAASQRSALWKTTLTEWAGWWRARAQVRLNVTRREGRYLVAVQRAAPGYRLAIEYCRGQHVALMPLDGPLLWFSARSVAYENRAAVSSVRPVRIDRPEGLRGRIRRLIDWERVTPIEEIGTDTWRNWAKRTLRRWRGR